MRRKGTADLTEFVGPVLVLGEGPGDQGVLQAIKDKLSLKNLECEYYGGRDELNAFLRTMPLVPGFQALRAVGITRDADDDASAAAQAIDQAIQTARERTPAGMVFPPTMKFVLPGAGRPGALEALCIEAVDGHQVTSCVKLFRSCLEAKGISHSNPRHSDKAWMAAFLSGQGDRPPMRLSEAARKGVVDIAHACFAGLRTFLHDLDKLAESPPAVSTDKPI